MRYGRTTWLVAGLVALSFGAAFRAPPAMAASAAAPWTMRDQGETVEAFTRNRAGSTALVLSCRPGGPLRLSLILSLQSGWRPDGAAMLDIDGATFPVAVEAFGAGVFLSDLAGGGLGLKPDTVRAIGAGKGLTLAGPATRAMTPAGPVFDLSGAGEVIARLEDRCGLARAAPAGSAPAAPQAAGRLPLVPGEYSVGRCLTPPDAARSIGLYTFPDGRFAGRQFLSPAAEGMFGICTLAEPLTVAGNIYSGAPSCESGGRASSDLGRFRFSFQVVDEKTFVSKGKTYAWCAAHR